MLTEGIGEARSASGRSASDSTALLVPLLLAGVCYQALLCFANTNFLAISPTLVAAAEAGIYAACLALLTARLRLPAVVMGMLLFAYLLLLALIREGIDIKSFRDLLIPLLFVWLGVAYGGPAIGDRVLKWLVAAVLGVGLIEFMFVDRYLALMDIYSYYVNQGNLPPGSQWVPGSVLALNGMRSEDVGRSLLPWLLGRHRVSSVFLEPVSLGNFAVIVAAWALAKPREELHAALLFFAAATVMVILSDSRYGLGALLLLLLVRVLMNRAGQLLAVAFPVLCILLLVAFGIVKGNAVEDNLAGRLAVSGFALMNMEPSTLLGIQANPDGFADMGYAYVLSRFGAPLFIMLWIIFWLIPVAGQAGERYRSLVSMHIAMILCISGTSLFALKTASVLWFLLGCLGPVFAGRPARPPGHFGPNATA